MEREFTDELSAAVGMMLRAFRKAGLHGSLSVRVENLEDVHFLRQMRHPHVIYPNMGAPMPADTICRIRGVNFIDGAR